MLSRLLIVGGLLTALLSTATAMVGNAPAADPALARHLVMIISSRGMCTGTVVARNIVLTAAHCVPPEGDYKLVTHDASGAPRFTDVARIARHPQFSDKTYLAHRATADVALVKLAAPVDTRLAPATLATPAAPIVPGDRLTIVGYGLGVPGDGRTGGTARAADLTVTGQPGTLQIRLVDPVLAGQRAGLGACTGDSGAPAFALVDGRPAVIGVVSWSTGPNLTDGCGGMTGVTPLVRYKDWILKAARDLASP
jgi:secreted trypsin-like serine protease